MPGRRPAVNDPAEAAADEGRRATLLRILRAEPGPRTVLSLAEQVQVHPNTVRFHLDALVRTGQVEQQLGESTGRGRPPIVFRSTRRMNPAGPTNYRLLAAMLAGHLATSTADPAAAAADLGRSWGSRILPTPTPTAASIPTAAPAAASTKPGPRARRGGRARTSRGEALVRLVEALAGLGFEPEAPTGPRDATVRLRHCPFLDLVTGHTDARGVGEQGRLICAVHLGLMQGALDSLGGPVTVGRLEPFAEPDLCVAHLAAAGGSPASGASADGAQADRAGARS